MADPQMDVCEAWIRARGLPQVLARRTRRRALLRRVSPLLTMFLSMNLFWLATFILMKGESEADNADNIDEEITLILGFILFLGTVLLSALAAFFVGWLLRKLPNGGSKVLAGAVCLAYLIFPAVMTDQLTGKGLFITFFSHAFILVILIFLAYLGVGNVLVWALKRSVSQLTALGAMIARVLPVFLVAVLFLFFNAEIWQVAAGIDYGRAFGVGVVLLFLALVVVVVTALDEMRTMFRKHEGREEQEEFSYPESLENEKRMRLLLRDTPFAMASVPRLRSSLGIGERVNLQLVAIAAQVIQVFLFTLLMGVFFAFFGQVAITDVVAKTWISANPEPMSIVDIKLPLSSVHFKVSFILACFSGLSFAASSNSDATYRKSFLDPVLAENEVNIAVRDAYRGMLAERELYGEIVEGRSDMV
ncbi:hypothetical protein [Austwickia chelonae]|uniref:hypothetical protein n=1 Tax=Austwickia chelonae TaxID=100225 RepID=UPI000E2430DD|nr:hypothetical protein [Austwickia chelonae]